MRHYDQRVRIHICSCGTVLDGDHNAALNILAKGLRQAGADLNTVGRTDLYWLLVTSTSKLTD
jgi:putative transposase